MIDIQEDSAITLKDFMEFLFAKSDEEQFKILLAHAEKNQRMIEARKKREVEQDEE